MQMREARRGRAEPTAAAAAAACGAQAQGLPCSTPRPPSCPPIPPTAACRCSRNPGCPQPGPSAAPLRHPPRHGISNHVAAGECGTPAARTLCGRGQVVQPHGPEPPLHRGCDHHGPQDLGRRRVCPEGALTPRCLHPSPSVAMLAPRVAPSGGAAHGLCLTLGPRMPLAPSICVPHTQPTCPTNLARCLAQTGAGD